MVPFAEARRNMVDCQLRTFDVHDRAILAAMGEVPRELFVPPALAQLAYGDAVLPLGADASGADSRSMLPPMVLARLLQALKIEPGTRVLDVAGGHGYSAALLARLGAAVTSLEARPDFPGASAHPEAARYLEGVTRRDGALAEGCPADGPFDAILVNGCLETKPTALLAQLAEGGRLGCIRQEGGPGRAMLFVRSGGGVGSRALFDASAPVLAAFRAAPAFAF